MEKGKPNGVLNALESISFENQNLQQCLKKIMKTKRLLEDKWDIVTGDLSSILEESYNLHDANVIICEKIQAMEKENDQLEKTQKVLAETVKNLKAEIKEEKEMYYTKIDNLVIASDKLCVYFLLAASNNETVEEECLKKLTEEIDSIKEQIVEKENNIAKIKKELEEYDFYDFPEDLLESQVPLEERQFIMNMMENNLSAARQKLEDLNKLKKEKEIEETDI